MGVSRGPQHWDNKNVTLSEWVTKHTNDADNYVQEPQNLADCLGMLNLNNLMTFNTEEEVLPAPCFSLSAIGFAVVTSGTSSVSSDLQERKFKVYRFGMRTPSRVRFSVFKKKKKIFFNCKDLLKSKTETLLNGIHVTQNTYCTYLWWGWLVCMGGPVVL